MNEIEKLMAQYPNLSYTFENMPNTTLGGLTIGNEVTINSALPYKDQLAWLYEEIGHYMTSSGDISSYNEKTDIIQERRARVWGMKHHLSKQALERVSNEHVESDYEAADELGVKVDYLHEVATVYGFKFKHVE